ncbi:MAG: AAA family ATPase [Cytophagales bacterium]|nr:MAG: AAA family ATPase [Cytophagales bacterium]TAF59871.1 MAG: AAA family ATPase [Cytophagales bacterium]
MSQTPQPYKIDLEEIQRKETLLRRIATELKTEFIGIDYIIDELLTYIRIWYLMPEVLTRPIIVNLWGMTGVGKTDLIRKLVKKLDFQDRFVEVELSNGDNTSWRSSVATILSDNGIDDGKPAIVLFDEIQRYYTIDADGKALENTKFTDFWELLSDGQLAKRDKEDFDYYINSLIMSSKEQRKRNESSSEPVEEDALNLYEAIQYKKMLSLEPEAHEIAEMKRDELLRRLQQAKAKKKIYEPVNHSKSLIIISGNLDEAYKMADQIAEADVDADIFHAFTKKITVVDIKAALIRKFKPEQVARFGNIHLIYRSLRKEHFEMLIKTELFKIQNRTQAMFGITVSFSDTVADLVYRNGVFPVQGVRPVFSSIIDIVETHLSQYLFEALMTQATSIKVDYLLQSQALEAVIDQKTLLTPFLGRIEEVRQANKEDMLANVSVHEAGHALVYALLFGLAPLQLKSKVASNYVGGFTFPHVIYQTKEFLLYKIKVYLAGGLAEELLFGKDNASIGRASDREECTYLAVDYIRRYGFEEAFQAAYTLDMPYTLSASPTDSHIEKLLLRLAVETNQLLLNHKACLLSISRALFDAGSLTADQLVAIFANHHIKVEVKEEGFLILKPYLDDLQQN